MTISFKRLADRPELAETLARWAWTEWPESVNHSVHRAILNFAARANFDQLPLALVALNDTLPIGMATLAMDRPPELLGWASTFVPCLTGLYVEPQWRNQGVGGALCDYVAGEALRFGFEEIHLYTVDAIAFYQARGWCCLSYDCPAFMRRRLVSNSNSE
jgi:GNAT superfamily N-acetyltransferase